MAGVEGRYFAVAYLRNEAYAARDSTDGQPLTSRLFAKAQGQPIVIYTLPPMIVEYLEEAQNAGEISADVRHEMEQVLEFAGINTFGFASVGSQPGIAQLCFDNGDTVITVDWEAGELPFAFLFRRGTGEKKGVESKGVPEIISAIGPWMSLLKS